MKIQLTPITAIKMYENNPRDNDNAVDAVAASISEFGFRQPIVIDNDNVIVAGHTRYKAAVKLGLEKVPVHVATDLTPDQIKAYRLVDNKVAELASWNIELLQCEIDDIAIELDKFGFELESVETDFGGNKNSELALDDDIDYKIVLKYNEDDYSTVKSKLEKLKRITPEQIFYQALVKGTETENV